MPVAVSRDMNTRSIPFGRPMIGSEERRAVLEVLDGPILTHGPKVKQFERAFAEFTGAEYAVAVSSCTAAMHLAYAYLGIGRGDEVIVPAQTHVATAHAVEYCGADCVFVDSEPSTGNIDVDAIESHITERTRAVAVVHYLGLPVDMDRLRAVADRHDLFVIEDCALSLGAHYKSTHTGLCGNVGCFSFYPVKHITTAEGGMLICRDRNIAETVARLRAFGIDQNIVGERRLPGMYDATALGFNYRLNEIGAALGLAQMKRLPGILRKRRDNYELLSAEMRSIDEIELLQSSHDGRQSSYYCLVAILKRPFNGKRSDVIQRLMQKGVQTSVYYPRPVPAMSYYHTKYGHRARDFPVAARISADSIALPVGPHLDDEDMRYVVEKVKETLMEVKSNG